MSLSTINYFYRPNNTYLEASLIKVMHIIIIDAILSYYLLYKLKLHAYYYRVLLLNLLDVLYTIKYYLKPLLTRYKPLHLVLTY